jgi:hypothetical protein
MLFWGGGDGTVRPLYVPYPAVVRTRGISYFTCFLRVIVFALFLAIDLPLARYYRSSLVLSFFEKCRCICVR